MWGYLNIVYLSADGFMVFEASACMIDLAEKPGQLMPQDINGRPL